MFYAETQRPRRERRHHFNLRHHFGVLLVFFKPEHRYNPHGACIS
jgi:hypothetical protein